MKRIETLHIKEFVVLSEILNYKKAAESLFISQTTLFNHVKALETELGISLFQRSGKRITLSEYGTLFQPYARAIIGNTEQFEREVAEQKKQSGRIIRIGSQYRITGLIEDFIRHYPDHTVHDLYSRNADSALYQSDYDLAFICNLEDPEEKYHVLPYIEDSIAVAVPPSHPLARQKSVSLTDLRDELFVQYLTPEGEETPETKMCEQAGFKPKVAAIVNGPEAIKLVRNGLGILFTNKKSFEAHENMDVALLDLDPPAPCQVSLCWRKDKRPSEGALAFIDFARQQSQE